MLLVAGPASAADRDGPVPVVFLEDAKPGKADNRLPLFQELPPDDPRRARCERLIRNEAAGFIRRLISFAWRRAGGAGDAPPLPIVLRKGGNHARVGYRLATERGTEEHPDRPYVLLEENEESLSHTLLHEGGHVVHVIVRRGRSLEPGWSALIHSTFAVTDPLTALSEGYAIHLETLWGHYGAAPERRAFYHRLAPDFDARTGWPELFWPVRDLMTFSQNWARYQAVRDGLPAFCGHVYPGDYLRSQYDPARDRARLKPPNAMVASEGVVASVLFWIVAGAADTRGAKPGGGLGHEALAAASEALVGAMADLPENTKGPFRPDLVDLVGVYGKAGSPERRHAVTRFVDLTRGVTARSALRERWAALYRAALDLDLKAAQELRSELSAARAEIIASATEDPATLRGALGPILPVRVEGRTLRLKALGEGFPAEFDLNTATEAEMELLGPAAAAHRERLLRELARRPFASLADFEERVGVPAARLGIAPAEIRK